jgi:hypothetical protein
MSEKQTQGQRIYPGIANIDITDTKPGDYWKDTSTGAWMVRCPVGELGNLGNHAVIEHTDGTITVSPSIRIVGEKTWHGYLNHGTWHEIVEE